MENTNQSSDQPPKIKLTLEQAKYIFKNPPSACPGLDEVCLFI
jgi:hypothetical protein